MVETRYLLIFIHVQGGGSLQRVNFMYRYVFGVFAKNLVDASKFWKIVTGF